MRAKKEFYLRYLKDNDNYKVGRSKALYFRKSSSMDSKNQKSSNKKTLSSKSVKKIEDKKEKKNNNNENCSFEAFVEEIKNYDYNQITKWDNEARKYTINIDKNINKVKLTELTQINYTNPLLILSKEYIKENYQKTLFESEITSIENTLKINRNNNINIINSNDIFDNQAFFIEKILEKREKLELNKKVLNYYLQYYCIYNAEMMNPSMSKIRELTNIIDFYYDKIHSNKKEILVMKKCNIDNTIKLILKKKKFENLSALYSILKNIIFPCYKDIKNLKLKKMNFNYIKYYEENIRLINEVALIDKNIIKKFNQDNANNNQIKKFNVIEEIKNKLLRKKEKFIKIYHYEKSNLFNSKKSYISHLYYLFTKEHNIQNKDNDKIDNNNDNQSSLFVTEMQKIYKQKLKQIILETVQIYRNKKNQDSNEVVIFNLKKPRLSEINNIVIEENTLIACFKNIFLKLKNHVDILLYYYNLINSNEKSNDFNDEMYECFKNEIKSRKNEFYEILDKNLAKLTTLFDNSRKKRQEELEISKNNLLFLINLMCLFEKMIKIKFNVKYNKYLNLALKNCIINQIKLENKKMIDKAMILLPNDIWEKNTLDISFFNIESMKERIPFHLRKFISFFNESEIKESLTSKLVNRDNIEDIFNYINNNENLNNNSNNNNNNNDIIANNINFDEVINLYINKINKNEIDNLQKQIEEEEKNLLIFNKPLKYNSTFITNSSCCILRGIEEQLINLVIFDSLTYEIFSELFDTIDLYIFISFKMFMKKSKHLSELLKNLNFKDIQKDSGNMEYWSDVISNQKKYMVLKKFCISMEKKFCEFFGHNKEFTTEEEKHSFVDKLIPNLNEIIILTNKEKKESKQFSEDGENDNNIFTYRKSYSNKDIKVNMNINNITDNNNEKKIDIKNNVDLDEDGIETLNINQINDNNKNSNNSKSNSTMKDKNEGLNFFNFFRNINGFEEKSNQEIPIEELIRDIKLKVTSLKIKQIIILISCILTLKKILKRLVHFTTKIELEDQRYLIINKINKYEKLIEQMRNFFYMKLSSEILDFSNISYSIEEYNWSPTPEEGSTQLFEASQWVKKLKSLFEVIVCEVHNKFYDLFGEKKLTQFFVDLIKYIINSVQESFAKIKKCNDMGRSIMLKDIKLLKEGIENTLKKYNYNKNIKINSLFDVIIQYANAWYYTSEELSKFIFNYSIQYKYFDSISNTSPTISELPNDAKNEFVNQVKQKYLSQFKKVISNINNDN